MSATSSPAQLLKQYFGYDQFRPLQAEIIERVLQKRDVLVLMPTGGGKSICYQLPALAQPGLAIVVSPLIALMKDQVEALRANGVPAAYLNSSLSGGEQTQIERNCTDGITKLLYVSPEKLSSPNFINWLKTLPISLFAIDEAHCISAWGHDFRPEYAQLKALKQYFPGVPLIALTATADKLIRHDIVAQLDLNDPEIFISSFDRKNLSLRVRPGRNRLGQILDFLEKHPNQPGIIYCMSRSSTEDIADKLYKSGYKASCYHAGLPTADRSATQEAFLRDDIQIICATIAFGMGIDKSNIRWVMHYNLPKNLESFYQEIGRAGRDGLPAKTVLFYSFRDVMNWRDMFAQNPTDRQELQIARLDRMQQYAEAHLCRRRILLNYFSEESVTDCGNCDVCRNPRTHFDGTVLAQKALSAAIRLQESVNMSTLIDVLRGSRSRAIVEKGYDKIKTYGAGADLKADEWREYLTQMVNTGVLDVAYHDKYAIHRGVLAQKVLNGAHQVWLVKPEDRIEMKPSEETRKPRKQALEEALFNHLVEVRKQLADQHNVPPYIIFNDNTVREIARQRPANRAELINISGVVQQKVAVYGDAFLKALREFVQSQGGGSTAMRGSTYQFTYELYEQGFPVEQIAQQRNLGIGTIQGHLVWLLENGYNIDWQQFAQPHEIQAIQQAIPRLENPSPKNLFVHFGEKYDYLKIRLALSFFRKEQGGYLLPA